MNMRQNMHEADSSHELCEKCAESCAAARDDELLPGALHRTQCHGSSHRCEHRQHRQNTLNAYQPVGASARLEPRVPAFACGLLRTIRGRGFMTGTAGCLRPGGF